MEEDRDFPPKYVAAQGVESVFAADVFEDSIAINVRDDLDKLRMH